MGGGGQRDEVVCSQLCLTGAMTGPTDRYNHYRTPRINDGFLTLSLGLGFFLAISYYFDLNPN